MSIDVNITVFMQLFMLIIVIIMAKFLFINPIKSTIDKRDEKIKNLKDIASSQIQTVEDSKRKYDERLAEVKAEISSHQMKVKEEASKEVESMISKAKEEVSKTAEVNRAELSKAIDEARSSLKKEVNEISELIYNRISGKAS